MYMFLVYLYVSEVSGAAHWLQCARPCGREVWPAPEDLGLKESGKHRSDLWPR